jgi:periplasmic divalent cation tolerance protein
MGAVSVFRIESTVGSAEEARALAAALVERRLAACVQVVGPIRSTFRWEGRVQEAEEHLLVCKVPEARLKAAIAAIEELHPYDLPEVLAFRAESGSPAYLDWVERECI